MFLREFSIAQAGKIDYTKSRKETEDSQAPLRWVPQLEWDWYIWDGPWLSQFQSHENRKVSCVQSWLFLFVG